MRIAFYLLSVFVLAFGGTVGYEMYTNPNVVIRESPLFTAGETIGAVTDCVPQGIVPPTMFACYAEILKVVVVRSDGWLEVQDERGNVWIINAARIYGFQRSPRAVAPEPVFEVPVPHETSPLI